MRWESLCLALITQVLQAGLKSSPSTVCYPETPEASVDARCHCSCYFLGEDQAVITLGCGGVIGALGASVACWCTGSQTSPSSPHPRRRGHGILSEPSSWTHPRSLLQ